MLPYLEFILLYISLIYKNTAGSGNCRTILSDTDHVLTGHVMRTLKPKSFESCTFSCELEPQCFSVNYILFTKTCQLNNVTKEYFPGDVVTQNGAFYMAMVIRTYHDPCVSMRCENGGTCVSSPSVKCECSDGFSGLRCEISDLHALGMESGAILNEKIEGSTQKSGYEAWKGRLNRDSCWMPTQDIKSEFIKVTFVTNVTVVAIATQGAPVAGLNCWVTSYMVQWFDGSKLKNDPKAYQANSDKTIAVTNKFSTPLPAVNWIRISPQSWSSCIAMRLEVYGY